MKNPYQNLDHVAVAVPDLEEALHTYGDLLGFHTIKTETLPDRGLEIAFLDAGNTHLELLGPTRPDSEISSFLNKKGPGIHHLCFSVHNIDKALSDLKSKGVVFTENTNTHGAGGRRVVFIHPKSAHGVLIELVETDER
jgi:methylmalonyl-CoA/ethylmalonyl-CoA epimerase